MVTATGPPSLIARKGLHGGPHYARRGFANQKLMMVGVCLVGAFAAVRTPQEVRPAQVLVVTAFHPQRLSDDYSQALYSCSVVGAVAHRRVTAAT